MKSDRFSRTDLLRLVLGIAWLVVFVLRPRLVAACTCLVIGLAFIAYNARAFWSREIGKSESGSAAPLFGGVIAAIGVALLPLGGSWKWAWLPLLFDWGGLPSFLVAWIRRDGD